MDTTSSMSSNPVPLSDGTATTDPQYAEELFTALGADDIPDSDKAILLLRMASMVQTRVLDKVYQLLNPEAQQQLITLMESDNYEETERFLQSTVPGYNDMFLEEAKLLRRELISRVAA